MGWEGRKGPEKTNGYLILKQHEQVWDLSLRNQAQDLSILLDSVPRGTLNALRGAAQRTLEESRWEDAGVVEQSAAERRIGSWRGVAPEEGRRAGRGGGDPQGTAHTAQPPLLLSAWRWVRPRPSRLLPAPRAHQRPGEHAHPSHSGRGPREVSNAPLRTPHARFCKSSWWMPCVHKTRGTRILQ